MLDKLLDYFVQGNAKDLSIDERYRGRLLTISSLGGALLIAPFAVSRSLWAPISDVVLICLALVMVVLFTAPFLYKYTASITLSGVYVNSCSSLVLMIFTFFDGGFYSTAIIWYPVLPLFAVFYSGRRYGLVITIMLFLHLCYLSFAHSQGAVPTTTLTSSQIEYLSFYSIAAVMALLLMLAFLYLNWQSAVQKELLLANEAKNDFLTGVSHELRTPLNSILGFSDVLERSYAGDLNDKQKEYIGYISHSSEHLLSLVDSLLDIGKIESGEFDLQFSPVAIPELFDSTVQLLKDKASQSETELHTHVESPLNDLSVLLDEQKINQVMINLVGNALKYAPRTAKVLMNARVVTETIQIEVIDDGPGIPVQYHEKIFERFYQIANTSELTQPGTGLGLAITRHFVELHHGEIYLKKSEQDSGCCFVVELPFKPAMKVESAELGSYTAQVSGN